MKKSKKYQNLSEQEIINKAIEDYGNAIKYMYRGISLREYCLKNNINIKTIHSRINHLKKQNNNLTNDELVILTMEEFENHNFKFFYNGIPLKEYCKNNNLNYSSITTYINREKERNSKLSDEELIKQYLAKEHKGIYKYYYLGVPLKQYCDNNNINYKNIIAYINTYKNTDNFKNLNNDELIEAIMENYQPFEPKYLYKGITLREYCLQNNLSYYSIVSFVKRKLAKGSNKTIDDLIAEGIKTINRYGIIYYYNGIPLVDYAKQNNLSISTLRCAILKKQIKSKKPLQEIVNECVKSYQKFAIKYYYNGTSLLSYCNKVGLNYNTVIQKYLSEYADNPNISVDNAIKQIVAYYIENPPLRTKYYFNEQSLAKFCNTNSYSYLAIYRRIKTLESKDSSLNNDQIIDLAIKKYEDRLQINKINEIFNNLKDNKINNIYEIKAICNFLKIDFENIIDLTNMDFSYNQAINMIWYFSDKKNDNDYKLLTDQKLKEIFSLINNLKMPNMNIEEFELYDLIGIYKSELYDSRNEILLRQKRYIYKTLFSLCRYYEIKINNSNYEDFEIEIKYYLLQVINRINLNTYGQIIKYMDLTVKGYFRTYLKKYKEQNNTISLDDTKYLNNRNQRNEKTRIEFIANSSEKIENSSFSSNMMNILSSLPHEDLSFIILKYQENYNDNELANYFNLTIEEIKQKEIEILSLLKNNDNIKLLKK